MKFDISEEHIIMLTQYEVMDQELPDDVEVFWPGIRDMESKSLNCCLFL